MKAARILLATSMLGLWAATAVAADTPPEKAKVVDGAIAASLTGAWGYALDGRDTFANRRLGNCLACHANGDQKEQLFHGEVGPALDGVATRYTPDQLRAIVVNSKAVFGPETVMPGFYSLDVGKNVAKDFVGKTILTADQVENIVAYLSTLK
jgi:sulfur-oxidizing protein SoxX